MKLFVIIFVLSMRNCVICEINIRNNRKIGEESGIDLIATGKRENQLLNLGYGETSYLAGIWKGNRLHCGGAVLEKNWILTAASCVINWEANGGPDVDDKYTTVSLNDLTIKGGDYDLQDNERYERSVKVRRIVVHPNFVRNIWTKTVENDLALIQVKGPFQIMEEGIQVALLPSYSQSQDTVFAKRATLVGWEDCGRRHHCGNYPITWSVLIRDTLQCFGFDLVNDPTIINPDEFCLNNFNLTMGSPSVERVRRDNVLFGIQSGACGHFACIHTKVLGYVPWIRRVLEGRESGNSGGNNLKISGTTAVFFSVGFILKILTL